MILCGKLSDEIFMSLLSEKLTGRIYQPPEINGGLYHFNIHWRAFVRKEGGKITGARLECSDSKTSRADVTIVERAVAIICGFQWAPDDNSVLDGPLFIGLEVPDV